MERAYRNTGWFLLAFIPVFVAGFWIPYFSEIPHFDPSITTVVHFHAVMLFGWLGLLIFQPFAIRYRAYAIHRGLGRASYVLMPLVLLSAIAVIWKEYNENLAAGGDAAVAGKAELLSVTQLVLLAVLYGLAISSVWRRDIAAHMRYMICIALILLPAGLARVLGYWFAFKQYASQTVCLTAIELCLIALIVIDRGRPKVARPYLVALFSLTMIELVWFALGRPV